MKTSERLNFAPGGELSPAGAQLAAAQGPDPAAWRAEATAERIRFTSRILPNRRPTFQQVVTFSGHRPR